MLTWSPKTFKESLAITCCVLTIALSTPFVALRLYTRRFVTRPLWWDDWCCVIGWIFEIALVGLLLKILDYGVDGSYQRFSKLFHDMLLVSQTGMFFTKASIVLLYRRLFLPPGTGRSFTWWSVWFVFYWNLLYTLVLIIVMVATSCVGDHGKAKNYLADTECQDPYTILVCTSVISVVSDLMILVIPIATIWGLHMAREKKIKLGAVFAVGSLGVLVSVARLGFVVSKNEGLNQFIVLIVLSSNLAEHMIGLIVSSMPSVPAFIKHLRGGAASSPIPFEPLSQRIIKKKSDRRPGGAHMGLNDRSLLYSANSGSWDARCDEMTDLDGQNGMQTRREGLEECMDDKATRTFGVEITARNSTPDVVAWPLRPYTPRGSHPDRTMF